MSLRTASSIITRTTKFRSPPCVHFPRGLSSSVQPRSESKNRQRQQIVQTETLKIEQVTKTGEPRVLRLPRYICRLTIGRLISYRSGLMKTLSLFTGAYAVQITPCLLGYQPTAVLEYVALASTLTITSYMLNQRFFVFRRVVKNISVMPQVSGTSVAERRVTVNFVMGKYLSPSITTTLGDFVTSIPGQWNLDGKQGVYQGILVRNYQTPSRVTGSETKSESPMMILIDVKGDRYGCLEVVHFCKQSADKLAKELENI